MIESQSTFEQQSILIKCSDFYEAWCSGKVVDGTELNEGFSDQERLYCLSQVRPSESLSVRFAAKRAASLISGHHWSAYRVVRSENGVPELEGPEGPWYVTLSHDSDLAVAYVMRATRPNTPEHQ